MFPTTDHRLQPGCRSWLFRLVALCLNLNLLRGGSMIVLVTLSCTLAHAADTAAVDPVTGAPLTEDPLTEVTTAQYTAADDLPARDSSRVWRPLTLPLMSADLPSALTTPSEGSDVWIRFYLPAPANDRNYSLLLWRYNLSAAVYFNGTQIAANSDRAGRLTTAWNRPLLANIVDDLWRPGDNEVLIRLRVTPWGGNLAPVLFGPRDTLQEIHDARLFRQVDINRILLAFAVIISGFTLALWLLRRQDTAYLWFSAAGLAWATGTLHTVIYHNPLPYDIWLPLVHSAIDSCTFFLYGFIGRLTHVRKAGRERLFLLWTLAACSSHFLVPPQWFWYSAYSMHLVGVTVLGFMILRVAHIAVRQRQSEAIVVTLAVLSQMALFSYSAFQMFFDNAQRWDSALTYAHFGIPVLLLVFSAVLLKRFTDALSEAETLNQELEQKLEQGRQAIARSYEERRLLERQQAAEHERLKIYRDLHDDVGSRLLSIIHAGSDRKMEDMARSALDSLRQAVSKANTPDQTLSKLLSDIREETELRLLGSGHTVDWQQTGELPDPLLASATAFNVNRIMKELVSNIIRHAGASHVRILVSADSHSLTICVTDNGVGLGAATSGGSGLNNIRSRAAEIAAQVNWTSSPQGTETRLALSGILT
ncbi:MAG: hypothetical protein CMQ34_05300 [Gammaproteobacteria bacterium]|nr:hypothetical protein [Gammaproteobacteria bacterium]